MSRFSFRSGGLPESVHVLGFRGEEALSSIYELDIYLLVPDSDCADLDLDDVLGSRGTLTIRESDAPGAFETEYHGLLREIELLHALGGKAVFRASLVPKLFELTQTHHSAMFTKQSIPDIVAAVLDDAGLGGDDVELRLASGPYVEEEHVCEYHESHYDFISRWMQREGMYFFFEHPPGPGEREKLVVADSRSAHAPHGGAPVRYHPVAGADMSAGASFQAFGVTRTAVPAIVRMQDRDYAKPALDVSAQVEVSRDALGTVVEHAGRFFTPKEGARLAHLRAEALIARASRHTAAGTVFGLRAGTTFELEDHPRGELNQEYLVTSVRHQGLHSEASPELLRVLGLDLAPGYRVEVSAIPASLQFRPEASAPWPTVHGFECGVVDGPTDSEYAQLDDQGRYLVKMRFDESRLRDGKASTRLRMMPPHGGALEGFHMPLRNGTEVVVAFQGGDPDRPFIAGMVPDATHPSPVTSDNHTKNVIQTGGRTRIELEDERGKQHVFVHTPSMDTYLHLGEPFNPTHYIVAHTKGDNLFKFGSNQTIFVGGKLTETVDGNVNEVYSTSQESTVTGPQRTTVTNPVKETYQATQVTVVEGLRVERFQSGHRTQVAGLREETYEAGQKTTVLGGVTENYTGGPLQRTVTGATSETYAGDLEVKASGSVLQVYSKVRQEYGATKATFASMNWIAAGQIHIDAPNWTVTTPSEFQLVDTEKFFATHDIKSEASSTGVAGLKVERTTTARSATGLKMEASGASFALEGPSVEIGGLHLEIAGFESRVSAINKVV